MTGQRCRLDAYRYYWHFKCPSRHCTAPVVRGGTGFTDDQAKALRATTPATLTCPSCGATMKGHLQKPKLGWGSSCLLLGMFDLRNLMSERFDPLLNPPHALFQGAEFLYEFRQDLRGSSR
jgi:hypothetical protein